MTDLRRRVVLERRARGWSVRAAATNAGPDRISNTTWGDWEKGKLGLTEKVQIGVALAFGWADDWPENPPELNPEEAGLTLSDVVAQVQALRDEIAVIRDQLSDVAQRPQPGVGRQRASSRK